MANYDGDITLTVDLEPGDITSTAEQLRKKISDLSGTRMTDKVSKSFEKIQTSMADANKEAGKLLTEIKKLETVKISPAYSALATQLDTLKDKHQQLTQQIQQAKLQRGLAKDARESMRKQDPDTYKGSEKYADLGKWMDRERKKVERYSAQLQAVETTIQTVTSQMQSMKQAGTDTVTGTGTQQYQDLVQQLNEVNNALTRYVSIVTRAQQYTDLAPDTSRWQSFMAALTDTHPILANLGSIFGNVAQEIAFDAHDIGAAWHDVFTNLASESTAVADENIQPAFATTREVFASLGSTIAKVASMLGSTFITGLRTLATTLAGVATSAAKASANLLKMVGRSIINGIRSLVSNLGKLASSLNKTHKSTGSANDAFKKGIKTLIKYGFGVRSFFFLWRKMRKAVGEGIGNLAQYSSPFNQVISNLISSLTLLKNAFATAFAPIINVVAPILSTFIDLVAEAVTKIGMLIAALTGKSTFIRAKKVQEDYAASLDKSAGSANDATKAAKEYKKTIAGFDDVEILKDPDSSSSSGGSGGGGGANSGPDVNDMFETVNIPDMFSNWAEKIKQAWRDADFTEIGDTIGAKISSILNNLPWDKIQENANKFGKSFATFFNGLMESEVELDDGTKTTLGDSIGTAIGETINTGITFLDSLTKNIHFDSIGSFIAKGMNAMTITVNWDGIATTLANAANGVFNAAKTWSGEFNFTALATAVKSTAVKALNGITWSNAEEAATNIGSGLADALNVFFTEDMFDSISTTLGNAVNTAITGGYTFIGRIEWAQWGETIKNGIVNFFGNIIDWKKIGLTTEALATGLGTVVNSLFQTAYTLIGRIEWKQWGETIKNGINNFFGQIKWETVGVTANTIASALAKALNTTFETAYTLIGRIEWKKWGETIKNAINNFFDDLDWETIGVTAETIATALANTLNTLFEGAYTLLGRIEWKQWGVTVGNAINNFFSTVNWASIGITFTKIATGIADTIKSAIETIDFKTVGENVATAFTSVPWDTLFEKAGELVAAGADALGKFLDGLLSKLGEALTTWFENNVPEEIKNFVNGIIEAYETITGIEEGPGVPETGSTGRPYGAGTIREGYDPSSNNTVTVTLTAEKDQSYVDNIDNDYDTTVDKPVKATADAAATSKWNETFGDSDAKWKHVNNKTVVATADGTTTTRYETKITNDYKKTGNKDVKVTADGATTPSYDNKIAGGNDRKDTYVRLEPTKTVKVTADAGTTSSYDSTIKGTANTNDGSYTNTKNKKVTVTADSKLTDYYKTTIKDPNDPKGGLAGLLGEQSVRVTADAKKTNNYKEIVTGEKYKTKKGKKVDTTGLLEIPKAKTSTVTADADLTKDFKSLTDTLSAVPKTKEVLVKIKGGITSSGRTALKAMVDIEEGATQSAYKNSQNVPTVQALGGAFFRGAWHSIAQYATGGIPRHGTMFVAGEAGAETVGHIHGRTEVLNQSQMAAVMYSAVVNGTASLVKVITSHMTTCTNATIANIGSMISYLNFISGKVSKLDNIETIIANATRTGLTDIVLGKVVPVFSGINDIPKINNALNKIVSMLQYNQDNQLTEDAFAETMTAIFRQYMNISFYLGDEQIAKHANAGNRQLEMRFNPVAR